MNKIITLSVFITLVLALSLQATASDIQDAELVTFQPNTDALAGEVNKNFTTLKNAVNTKQDKLSQKNCVIGSVVTGFDIDGNLICDAKITGISTGGGLSGGGTSGNIQLSTNPAVVQSRVSNSCAEGSSIRLINENGSVECEFDDDNGLIDITAGNHISLSGSSQNPIINVQGMPGIALIENTSTQSNFSQWTNVANLNVNIPMNGFIKLSYASESLCLGDDGDGNPISYAPQYRFVHSQSNNTSTSGLPSYVFPVETGTSTFILQAECTETFVTFNTTITILQFVAEYFSVNYSSP